jgi:hypothetical protein
MAASTRRAALGAILAAPLTGGAVMALPSAPVKLRDHEAQFLVLVPTLLPKLVEYDRLWAEATRLYSVAEQAHPHPDPRVFNLEALKEADRKLVATPEWVAYLVARRPADDPDADIDETVAPFMDLPMVSLLKHRIGMTLGQYEDDARDDIDRLAKEALCT